MTTMKQRIYILALALAFWSCNTPSNEHSDSKSKDTIADRLQGDAEKNLISLDSQSTTNNTKIGTFKDSTVYFSDTLFKNLELEFTEISRNIFQGNLKNYKPACDLDSNGFIKEKGLIYRHTCKDICEDYLIDRKEGVKLVLPSDYDAGITGLLFSPSCNQFIVYSSYDSPDYSEYYEHRAELFGFTITQGQGFKTIKPSFKYYTKDWSVDNVTWTDEHTLALKLYDGQRTESGVNLGYSYFKANLKVK